VKPGAVLWDGGLGIYEFPKRLATRFNMKKAVSIQNNICCTTLLSGTCVFCIVAPDTIKKAQVSEYKIHCFSMGLGLYEGVELRLFTSCLQLE